ncbi:hypothetical protein HMPREF3213_01612 [Heyndrickxia coagulans]|uniref:Uncharacterized protein n=1 Tax=Heyndrickxia coagulans TaxID=1398 RepID=A0A133KTF5_HEYCO|nr:hypothetical protein HMPREF3213_01612 [Heyndrickxia coagulans]
MGSEFQPTIMKKLSDRFRKNNFLIEFSKDEFTRIRRKRTSII